MHSFLLGASRLFHNRTFAKREPLSPQQQGSAYHVSQSNIEHGMKLSEGRSKYKTAWSRFRTARPRRPISANVEGGIGSCSNGIASGYEYRVSQGLIQEMAFPHSTHPSSFMAVATLMKPARLAPSSNDPPFFVTSSICL